MKKMFIITILVATGIAINLKSFAEEGDDGTRYKTSTCTVTHADGTTTGGVECWSEDPAGPCFKQANCNDLN